MTNQPSRVRTPSTRGRTWGLGRDGFPMPREHCKRCAEITARADQMVTNYILANAQQVQIINRLLKNPDPDHEVLVLGEQLAEAKAVLEYLYDIAVTPGLVARQDVRDAIDTYRGEVGDASG